jgi:hypothetical protein
MHNFFPSLVATSTSALCLVSTIGTYLTFAELRNLPGLNIMALSVDTLTYQLLFLFGVTEENVWEHPGFCEVSLFIVYN